MAALLLNGSSHQLGPLMCARKHHLLLWTALCTNSDPPTPTHRKDFILCGMFVCQLYTSSACYCFLPPSPPSPGRRAKFDVNDSDKVQPKSLTAQNVDTQCLNPQLSTSEDVKLEQSPAFTDTELHKPTTEPQGKEDAAGETSDDVKLETPAWDKGAYRKTDQRSFLSVVTGCIYSAYMDQ